MPTEPLVVRHPGRRLAGIDLARALAMLGMLIEHMLQYPKLQTNSGPLWAVYGRSAPLFVMLAGVGLSLATRSGRPLDRSMVAARAPLLLLTGMALTVRGDGVILQSFALFFLVGLLFVRVPPRALAIAAGACLVVGPLFLTLLRRHQIVHFFDAQREVGFHGLVDPFVFVRGLFVSYYPAVIWLGFFFVGMFLGRTDLSSVRAGRRLFGWGAAAAVLLFTVGWAGARAFGPAPDAFSLAPKPPTTYAGNWTTYGFSNSVGWALSCTALAIAILGACVWIVAARPVRVLAPLVALGAMPLTFYILHFVFVGTIWTWLQPKVSSPRAVSSAIVYLLVSLTFWLVFAAIAGRWLSRFRRGPFEIVLHATAVALTAPWRIRRGSPTGEGRVLQRVTPQA